MPYTTPLSRRSDPPWFFHFYLAWQASFALPIHLCTQLKSSLRQQPQSYDVASIFTALPKPKQAERCFQAKEYEIEANRNSSWTCLEGEEPDLLVFCQSSFPGCKQIFVPEFRHTWLTLLKTEQTDCPPPLPQCITMALDTSKQHMWTCWKVRIALAPTACFSSKAVLQLVLKQQEDPALQCSGHVPSYRSLSFSNQEIGRANGRGFRLEITFLSYVVFSQFNFRWICGEWTHSLGTIVCFNLTFACRLQMLRYSSN